MKTEKNILISHLISKGRALGVLFFCLGLSFNLSAQSGLVMEHVSGPVWMLSGGGYANISVLVGDNRALMVDSKRPELVNEIRAMVRQLSGGDVEYLINGHVHPDHTDGNEGFGEQGAIIIAHEEVRRVLMAGQRGGPPAPTAALPVLTIANEGSMTLHFDGETVHITHAPPAHSLGNVMVRFEQANVIHLGDLYSPERYPVIAGGSVNGFISANENALALANEETFFIAGNGVVTQRQQVQAYINMVLTVKERVAEMIADGMSQEEVIAAKPSAEFDSIWGDPGRFLPALYRELSAL
ncbi:MBL fold metallo-hydrolase [Gammaproteobacteria bacterium]|nr:MBL fold metallo-hydrolase [Gammaproteobacteria bacterium]